MEPDDDVTTNQMYGGHDAERASSDTPIQNFCHKCGEKRKEGQDVIGYVYYGEGTLEKVRDGLVAIGMTVDRAYEAITSMQNQGILFREPGYRRH